MEQQVLTMISDRLRRIEEQNDAQLALIQSHLEKDGKVWRVVERHSTYFAGLGLVLTPAVAYVLNKIGLK